MTPEEFVAEIKRVVFEYASDGALQPLDRQRDEVRARVWDWYTGLSSQDQAMVRHVMRITTFSAVFGFFAVLDGTSPIGSYPHGTLRLTYADQDGNEQRLNPPEEDLNLIWINDVFPDTGQPPELDFGSEP